MLVMRETINVERTMISIIKIMHNVHNTYLIVYSEIRRCYLLKNSNHVILLILPSALEHNFLCLLNISYEFNQFDIMKCLRYYCKRIRIHYIMYI